MTDLHQRLNVRGLDRPLPGLRNNRTIGEMDGGVVLRARATDPAAIRGGGAFRTRTGGGSEFLIRKRP